MVGTVATLGTLGQTVRHSREAVTGSVISGWDSCDTWDRGPQPLIYFTTGDMVVGETITIDHLVSVYQGDANAVSDEGTIQKKQRTSLFYILTSCEYARITLYLQQCQVTNRRRLDSISRQKGATA
jgi:hypothetical protein